MATMTTFCPATDAFAFDNSWSIDGRELEQIRRFLAEERAGVVRLLARSRLVRWLVRQIEQHRLVSGVLREEHLTRYGLCGGVAFAALDYFREGWVIPQGTGPDDHPTHASAAGSALRNYIWQRLLDSMQGRAAGVMFWWSLALHVVPSLGARWVLNQTRREWQALTQHLDAGQPWPIGLVGRAHGSFANHQVLAYGYEAAGEGVAVLYVYDSCCPRSGHTIVLDFRGRTLRADESCGSHGGETRWKGLFCDAYAPARPPIAVGALGIAAAPDAGGIGRTVRFAAQNVGFSRCPPLALRVGKPDAAGGERDLGGEDTPRPLEAGACRAVAWSAKGTPRPGAAGYEARCRLVGDNRQAVWKRLPVLDAAASGDECRRDATTPADNGPGGGATRGKEHGDGARR